MKITDVKFLSMEIPLEVPLRPAWDPSASYRSFPLGLVGIYTDEGQVGSAVELTPQHVMGVTGSQISYLKSAIVGADPFEVERIRRKLRYAAFIGWIRRGSRWSRFRSQDQRRRNREVHGSGNVSHSPL